MHTLRLSPLLTFSLLFNQLLIIYLSLQIQNSRHSVLHLHLFPKLRQQTLHVCVIELCVCVFVCMCGLTLHVCVIESCVCVFVCMCGLTLHVCVIELCVCV